MPLYTYVMNYKGVTKVVQIKRSNYMGFIGGMIAEAYPSLRQSALAWRRPEPVLNAKRTWGYSTNIAGDDFTLHVVETRD
jgi:hypothetical protein